MSGVVDELSHLISLHAQQQIGDETAFAIGHVVAYDPTINSVQVVFPGMPVVDPLSGAPTGEYSISPWVQLNSPWVGNGWGFQTAPEVGDAAPPFSGTQCAVYQDARNGVSGLAAALLYNETVSPPDTGLVAGEAILKHQSGTYIKFNSQGELEVYAAAGLPITLGSGEVVSINGTADALALVSKLVSAFNVHTHSSGGSGPPNTPWSASTIESAIVKVDS